MRWSRIAGVCLAIALAAAGVRHLVRGPAPAPAAIAPVADIAALADTAASAQKAFDLAMSHGSFEEIASASDAARGLARRIAAALAAGDPTEDAWAAVSDAAVFAARWGAEDDVLANLREPLAARGVPKSSDVPLLLLIGRLLRDRGDHHGAAELFGRAAAVADSMHVAAIRFLAGSARAAAGEYAAADSQLAAAVALDSVRAWRTHALLTLARNALAQNKPDGTIAWLDSLQGHGRMSATGDTATALYLRAFVMAERHDRAINLARVILAGRGPRLEALEYLRGRGITLSLEETEGAALGLMAAGRLDQGAALLEDATAAHQQRSRWLAMTGEWFLKARRYDDARSRFTRVLQDSVRMNEPRSAALLGIARAWRSERNSPRLEAAYRRAAREAPLASARADALFELARELDEAGRGGQALALYRAVRDDYPESANAGDARFAIGLLHWREGRRRDAAIAFANARDRAGGDDARNRALVWLAKTRVAAADMDSARSLLRQASRTDDFYGTVASVLDSARTWDGGTFTRAALGEVAGARGTNSASRSAAAGADRIDAVAAEDADTVIELLADLGFAQEAEWLLRQRPGPRTHELDRAVRAARRNLARAGIQLAEQLRHARESAPLRVARLRYPVAWVPEILAASSADGVDPLLVYSVIRQESVFDPRALSRAGARGLLQLMPATARAEARSLGRPEPAEEALYDVETNLRLGTHHMARLFERFPGELHVALAAYNANPDKAREWRERSEGDPDLFIETIGWRETRGYVKTVLRNLLTYRTLY